MPHPAAGRILPSRQRHPGPEGDKDAFEQLRAIHRAPTLVQRLHVSRGNPCRAASTTYHLA
jgi:hypothetical protein